MRVRMLLLGIGGVLVGIGAGVTAELTAPPSGLSEKAPEIGLAQVRIDGQPADRSTGSAFGFLLLYRPGGSQAALMQGANRCVVSCMPGQTVEMAIPLTGTAQGKLAVRAIGQGPGPVEAALGWIGSTGQQSSAPSGQSVLRWQTVLPGQAVDLQWPLGPEDKQGLVMLAVRSQAGGGPCAVQWRNLAVLPVSAEGKPSPARPIPIWTQPAEANQFPPPELPPLHPAIEEALIEWDWRMQDGLGTPRCPSSLAEAIQRTLERTEALIGDLQSAGAVRPELLAQWNSLRTTYAELRQKGLLDTPEAEELWLRMHRVRREMALANPLFPACPIVFIKNPHSMFSHQLTQYPGNCARPGGGVFVLEQPGRSMRCRSLTAGRLPTGAYQFVDVAYDGGRVLFAYCPVDRTPKNREEHLDHFFHLHEVSADGSQLRSLTTGPYDDFAGRYLPDGRVIFVSTRRGGFHRCGQGPCPVHTLALCEADGSQPRVISYHETHEWDPAVLQDGRVIYTRWDYVDRNAVFYQQLWTVRPDGTDVRIFYGNNTFNPVGIWEAQAVPGSHRVMATASAHHAMSAGSIILVDVRRGVDGLEPIQRLTPDALFPESEAPVIRGDGKPIWHNPVGVREVPPSVDQQRWPGHCYKSPWPLSETYFLAAYSFDSLIGEPDPCRPNMFGLYLVDRFGNKELLYRDLNISSLWPVPLRPRPRPPAIPRAAAPIASLPVDQPATHSVPKSSQTATTVSASSADGSPTPLADDAELLAQLARQREGIFLLQNVYRSWPALPAGVKIHQLRVVQVLPKSTWHINQPTVGLANASPGRQVLGTVPVEADGSALFRAPAGLPLAFQALDEMGQAVQTMRSITYLQPGEVVSCIGCHEPRHEAPVAGSKQPPLALRRAPSGIRPGPDGSRPFSYPLLVQPVLDRHCIRCHGPEKKEGGITLTGEPQDRYTVSYHVLAPRVPYSAWGGKPGDFRQVNSEPMTQPDFFGARASPLMQLLRRGHYDVRLSPEDYERLITWMDTNGLFYGTFDPADQARQQRGERIPGPALQ